MIEQAIVMGGNQSLVGIVTEPEPPWNGSAALVLNAGMVHRVGPSRLGVRLARQLAKEGYRVVRFDHSGVGDSWRQPGESRSWEDLLVSETREVMDGLADLYDVRKFIVVGLCSGAVTAFRTATVDERVSGIVMINAMGHSTDDDWNMRIRSRKWVSDYVTKSAVSIDSWKRALTGRIRYRRLYKVLTKRAAGWLFEPKRIKEITNQTRSQFREVLGRGIRTLVVHSSADSSFDYFNTVVKPEVESLRGSGDFDYKIIDETDHTFTVLDKQRDLVDTIATWANRS